MSERLGKRFEGVTKVVDRPVLIYGSDRLRVGQHTLARVDADGLPVYDPDTIEVRGDLPPIAAT